jgi:hypothetical protein
LHFSERFSNWKPHPQLMTLHDEIRQFDAIFHVDREKWHDGVGYDLEALGRLSAEARQKAAVTLVMRLNGGSPDWRDLEALEFLGETAAVDRAMDHAELAIRFYAARLAQDAGRSDRLTAMVLEISRTAGRRRDEEIDKALEYASRCPVGDVKAPLLRLVRHRKAELAMQALFAIFEIFEPEGLDVWDVRRRILTGGRDRDEAIRELQRAIG